MIDLDKWFDIMVNFAEAKDIIEAFAMYQSVPFYMEPQNKGMTRIWVQQEHADILEHMVRVYTENLYLEGKTCCPFCREENETAEISYTNVHHDGGVVLGRQCTECNGCWEDHHNIGKEFAIYHN